LAEPTFDRGLFKRRLATSRLGQTLVARAEAPSTNDLAWELLSGGAPDGTTVVADAQPLGRGRGGRAWHLAPGKGLALSLVLHQGLGRRQSGTLPLVVGLALALALERLQVATTLKWPNDVLVGSRKLAGVLCESRRLAEGSDVAVVGVGVNVSQQQDDFPPALHGRATSLAMEGCRASREETAAEFLNALEPLWAEHQEGGRAAVLDAWRSRAGYWGRMVTVRTPAGPLAGVARDLSPDGGLVLRLASGREVVALAGDLDLPPPEEAR
jgi:BirA family biotin operon repressor/biotin-[acetyl-CoA-carboxylase] ligase